MLMLINCGIDVVEPCDELPIIRKKIRINLVILVDDSGILQGRRIAVLDQIVQKVTIFARASPSSRAAM